MPGETTSEITKPEVSALEKDSPKQSKPDSPDNKHPEDVPNESTSSSSTNELTNGLKRPLPDEVDSNSKKKIRLSDLSDDELEKITNKDDSGKNHIELLMQKVSESIENTIDDECNVSSKTNHNHNNEPNSSSNIIHHNGNNGMDVNNIKDINNKTSHINNVNNSCEFIGNSKGTVLKGILKLGKKDILTSEGISCSNKSSSSDNLVITENSNHENEAIVDGIHLTENKSTAVNDSTVRESNSNHSNTTRSNIENIVNSNKNDAELLLEFNNKIQNLTKNTDETQTIESCPSTSNTNICKEGDACPNGIDRDFEVIESDDSSDISSPDLNDLSDISNIFNGVKEITKEHFPEFLKLFSKKNLTYDQFDSFFTQKLTEMMTEKIHFGGERSELQMLKEREKHWRLKYSSLNRQFKEMKTIVHVHKQELKTNENAKPHIVTRTVGLQAVLSSKKCVREPIQSTTPKKCDNNPVSIMVDDDDDDDDVVVLDTVTSASSATTNIANTTTKKQLPPLITISKSPAEVSPNKVTASLKTVTAAKSHPTNIGTTITTTTTTTTTSTSTTIDLTGNDDVIEESNIINLEETISPVNGRATNVAKLNGKVLKNYALIEIPNNSSATSSFIMRTDPCSPQRTIVSNKNTINTSPKSKILKPILVSRVDPVLVQPCTVTYTAQRVPVSQISGTLQPMSTAPYTPHQITMSDLSKSLRTLTPGVTSQLPAVSRMSGPMPGIVLPQASPGKAFTACRPQTGSQLIRKPPPPAIPFLKHPSPVPGIPIQRSLSTWKRLPPAPILSITKELDSSTSTQGTLVLSWTINLNKTYAEVMSYQIYAYQESVDHPPSIDLWKKIGDVSALSPPMACSLTHFSNGQKYHFLVRAVDVYTRVGPFSLPESIT